MVSQEYVDEQLEKIGFNAHGWGRGEISELPHILLPDEIIYEAANGYYEGGFALVVSTDIRVLLVDKKPLSYLTVEDLRFDMINEIDYSHRVLGSTITIATGNKTLVFHSYNKARLRKLIGHVQHSMAESKKKQSSQAEGQSQHLERINEQLQAYLVAQYKQQQKLQEQLAQFQQGVTKDVPQTEPLQPSDDLKNYLYSRSLLGRYQQDTGADLKAATALPVPEDSSATEAKAEVVPANEQLAEIYADGIEEVFGKYRQPTTGASPATSSVGSTAGLVVNPIKVAYSKLPMLLRSRRLNTKPEPI